MISEWLITHRLGTMQKYALWFDGFVDMSSCKDGLPAVDGFQVTVSTELGKNKKNIVIVVWPT